MTLPPGAERTVVVGLDGASFHLLDRWIDAGELPTIEQIVTSGVRADLESVLPPITSPNWKAYSTGKNPGKLGIFWWRNIDVENEGTYVPSDRYNDHTEFWEIIGEDDEPVGVVGQPLTSPPKPVNGFVVPGGPEGRTGELVTHPRSLEADVRDRFGYSLSLEYSLREETEEAYEEVHDAIDTKFTTAKHLMDEYDASFLQVTTFHINQLHHHIWDHEKTLEGWKLIDDHLESFLDGRTNLVLMSDHGMAEIESVFRINHWLERHGYLAYDTGTTDTLYSLGINTGRLQQLLKRIDRHVPAVDLSRLAADLVPQRVLDHLPNDRGELGATKFSRLDWEDSVAIASAQGPVYLTVDRDDPEYEPLRQTLVDELSDITDPNGRPVADAVHRSEDIYSGPHLDEAPDIVIEQAEGTYIVEGIGNRDVFAEDDDTWQGVNARSGLFAATGPSFTSESLPPLSILDLAPTLLHLHDCEIPADMDGTPRLDLFEEGSRPAERDPSYGPAREPDQEGPDVESGTTREQLEDLGYI